MREEEGGAQATTGIGTEDPESTVSPAKNRCHPLHSQKEENYSNRVGSYCFNYRFVIHMCKNMLKGIVFSRNR